ncbi:MAG: ubiquitin carboxyl-terminal hydrolase, partial [Oscillospiraceae bacterium]|nr:ubiquitin carboxyl-terminal hydrolase [Oscillospiraceae bacterium]
ENSNLEEQDSDENILNEKSQNSPKLESNFSESNFNPFLKESNNSPSIISQKSRLTNNLPLRPHLPQINSQSKPPFINNKPPLHPSNIPQEASFLKSKFNPFFKNPNSFSPTIAPKADSINLLPSFSKYHSRVPPFPSQAPPISAKSSNFPKNAPQTQVKVTGLTNKRNMCYLNSALIVIVYNKEFQNLILKLDDSKLNQFPLLKELKQITSNLTKGISCDSVKIASILRLARPGDPSEVFRQFLSKIENEAKKHNDFAEILSFFKKFWGEIGSSGSEQDCNVVPLYPEDTIRHLDERLINHYTTHFKFARPPQILLLHFNRFVNKTTISKEEIIFKNEINVNNNKYVLNSLICNIKTSRGYTHYVVYKLIEGQWYYFDDENVSKTTAGEVLSKTQNCFIFEYVQS